MSAICIVNLKKYNLEYDELNDMAKKIVKCCLDHGDLAAFFHSSEYQKKLIEKEDMRLYFLLSDSFLYRNCTFLDDAFYVPETDLAEAERIFRKRFDFFPEIFEIIFQYDVSEITVYVDDSEADINDFELLSATTEEFLPLFFHYLVEISGYGGYTGVPSLKITVTRPKGKGKI